MALGDLIQKEFEINVTRITEHFILLENLCQLSRRILFHHQYLQCLEFDH